MIGLILKVIAAICFLLAAVNQDIFGQGQFDLVAFGLLFWVLAELLGGYGPASPIRERA